MTRSAIVLASVITLAACNDQSGNTSASPEASDSSTVKLKEEAASYPDGAVTMNSFVVYNPDQQGPRPAVLVIPEWWGLTEYARNRARQLAELGYIAMAVDMYGDGKTANNPDSAKAFAGAFYADPTLGKTRFDAALAKLKTFAQTDSNRVAAIGYCFGGAQALNMARLGENLKGVVSFHGNLVGVPADKALLKAEILVCHGAADPFVPQTEVDQFKKQMDSIGATYTFKAYPDATHAFTNPEATELGKKFNMPIAYNAAADTASWNDMRAFFDRVLK